VLGLSLFDSGAFIDLQDLLERHPELGAEIFEPFDLTAELRMERQPGEAIRLAGRNPVQALRQPCVDVQSHGGMTQPRDVVLVERDGVFHQASEFRQLCRKAGGDLEQIQLLLGHASVQTTERYLGTEQDLARAVNDNLDLDLANI
jgi:hypothetical protein